MFSFHAAPRSGEWVNDPNGLVYAGGRYRLFVQHSAESPDFKSIGWARLSSDDLLHWDWDGRVIAPDPTGLAYSGSVTVADDVLTAWLTRHDAPLQRQYRLSAAQAGAVWQQDAAPLGPEARNMRDPFVFECSASGKRRMLLAEPCDWHDWSADRASRLSVWSDSDGDWAQVGTIGPWSPPGVMWEVPVLIDFGSCQFLVVSMIDRRGDASSCSVRAWRGTFGNDTFAPDNSVGELLDYGPDFYATCFNTQSGWPQAERVMLAWASNWSTARTMAWPGGVCGGAISLPRVVDCRDGRLWQAPLPASRALGRSEPWAPGAALRLDFGGRFDLRISPAGIVTAERRAPSWRLEASLELKEATNVMIFEDSGLLEIFFETAGKTLTAFIGERER